MLIQKQDDYELGVSLAWLSPEELHLKITTTITESNQDRTHTRSYFISPEQARLIADHINDVLCR